MITVIFTIDYCNAKRNSTVKNVQVEILSSLKVTSLGTTKALRAKLRKMPNKRVTFGGELDFTTNGFYLNPGLFNC